ncbi:hypothetical protein MAR_031564 [Mya arenaria]|uniref:Uncharacterized protein n=1 Tax=Mya arenaria TaxID=6604 RepID=A0ABY7F472_MYAAR|nr:hypothetical protein MAR_031564 [Mya arenaria]
MKPGHSAVPYKELDTKEIKNGDKKSLQASFGRRSAIMVACLALQFIAVGYGYGLSVMYVEIIRVFDAPRSEAALTQSLYFGIMTGGGPIEAWFLVDLMV